ncbi:MAG: ABC transporter ATP-binding protein [Verrucomicrobia bacterium]|nr:ABC transporter ATP-binding protein [Verrucomicrobiota bacterium]
MRIELKHVYKNYGAVDALRDVNLDLRTGAVHAVIGLNGAGKTTLLQVIAGLRGLEQGEVWLAGERFQRGRLDLRRRFGYLPDVPLAFAEHTVLEQCAYVVRSYGREADDARLDRVVALLEEFDLLGLARRRMSELSRGQLYKLSLAALLACDCELLLLDEPFASGADARGLAALKRHALALAARGGSVVFTTQIVETLPEFAQHVVVLDQGAVRHSGPLAELSVDGRVGAAALELMVGASGSSAP